MSQTTKEITPTKEHLENLARSKADPLFFIEHGVYTLDQVDSECPIKRFPVHKPYLRLFIKLWLKYPHIAIPKSRRMTMSWTNVTLYTWDTLFNQGRFYGFVSKKEEDSGELVDRAEFIYDHIPEDFIPKALLPKKKRTTKPPVLSFPEINSKIQGFPMGANQLRQFTFSGLLGDECAFWPEAQKFYSASRPTLDGGGRMTLISSRAPGFFKRLVYDQLDKPGDVIPEVDNVREPMQGIELWLNPTNGFLIIDIHYTADEEKRSPEFAKDIRASMPLRDYLMEYERNWETFEGLPVYEDFNKAIHESKIPLEAHMGLPLLLGWDFGRCYDDETEVMTDSGWKLFKDVNIAVDKIATLNPETFETTYVTSDLKIDEPYVGDMYHCEGVNLNFTITPDHIMPHWTESGRFERKYARDLLEKPGHRKLRLTGNWQGGKDTAAFGLDPITYASFMGAYLSEGTSDDRKIVITQLKAHPWLEDIIKATGWEWKKMPEGYCLNNSIMAREIRKQGLQKDRRIPRIILDGTRAVLTSYLNAYTEGDGHRRTRREGGKEEHTIFTTSPGMADDLQELAFRLGWNSSIRRIKPQDSYYETEDRVISSTGGYSIHFKKNCDWADLRSYQHTLKPYNGRIYCLKVPHHTLYVRKNGRPHWNGNTPACVVAQLQDEQVVILGEYVEQNMGIERFAPKVMNSLRLKYPEWNEDKDFISWVDPSGFDMGDKDERTCVSIMSDKDGAAIKDIRPGLLRWEPRRAAVNRLLLGHNRNGSLFKIHEGTASTLFAGFAGGYRYPEKMLELEPKQARPLKDKHSHPHDGFQYLAGGIQSLMKTSAPVKIPTPQYNFTTKEGGGKPSRQNSGASKYGY